MFAVWIGCCIRVEAAQPATPPPLPPGPGPQPGSAHLTAATVRMGPPTPQPTSSAVLPGPSRMVAAAQASCATSEAAQSRLGSLREKWKDWPQPHS